MFSLSVLVLMIVIIISIAAWIPSEEARLRLGLHDNWDFKRNWVKYILIAVVVIACFFVLNYIVHGKIYVDIYELPLMFLAPFLFSPGLTQIYGVLKRTLCRIWFKWLNFITFVVHIR
jgi:hypothetical protein